MPDYLGRQTLEGETRTYYLALGLMAVSSYLKEKKFDVHTINLNHYGPEKLTNILKSGNFDLMCTGGIHVDIHKVMDVVNEAKKCSPNIITIVGGSLATCHPSFVLDIVNSDYLVLKEGEQACADLISNIQEGGDPEDVLGIAFKKDGKFIETPEHPLLENLDDLPFPDYEGFEYAHYLDNFAPTKLRTRHFSDGDSRQAMITGSRDCPAKCTFCFRNMGGDYRERTVDNIMAEIKYLIDTYKINEIDLNDEIFALNRRRVYEFCEKIKSFNVPWSCQMRVNLPDDEILRRLKDAGCVHIVYGLETASPTVLKSMKKGVRLEQIINAIDLTKKHQIALTGNWIFGDPAETVQTCLETIEFNRRYDYMNFSMFFLLPYPGTPLYFDILEKGSIKDKLNFYLTGTTDQKDHLFNMTGMSHEERCALEVKIRLETEQLHSRAKIITCDHINGNDYNMSVVCPSCDVEDSYYFSISAGMFTVSSSTVNVCRHCYSRFALNYYEFAGFHNPIKKAIIMYTDKVYKSILFLLTLKFEPNFYRKKGVRFFCFPFYLLVNTFKVNSILIKLVNLIRNSKKRDLMALEENTLILPRNDEFQKTEIDHRTVSIS